MISISEILQGPETTLFQRVFQNLQRGGLPRKHLMEFEKHKGDGVDELLEVSEKYLLSCGFYL